MGIRARVFLIVFFSLAVSIRIAYVIAERDITSTFEEQTIYQLEKQAQLLLVNVDDVSKYGDIKAADLVADKLGNASNSRVTLILNNGVVVGETTSGAFGYRVNKSIALGVLRTDLAVAGTEVEVEIFGQRYAANVQEDQPLWDADNSRLRA